MKIVLCSLFILTIVSCAGKHANDDSANRKDADTASIKKDTAVLKTNKMVAQYRMQYIDIPVGTAQIDREFERLDLDSFNLKKISGEYKNKFESEIEIWIEESKIGIYYMETFPDTYFSILKRFDLNGFLMEKGLVINHSNCLMGVQYYYNEAGELVEEIDWDKPYKFTFDDVLKFCRKENIIVMKGNTIPEGYYLPATFYREVSDDGKCWWRIDHFIPQGVKQETIILDGNTGKVISRKSEPITL